MTTVLPENSRMYGSASARMSAFSPAAATRASMLGALTVTCARHDVRRFSSMYACERSVVSTVASPCARCRSHSDLDLAARHVRGERGLVVRAGDAVAAHGDAVVGDVDPLGIDERAARAELREHPAPVRSRRR